MTRSELLKRVAGRTPDISKKDMELVIDDLAYAAAATEASSSDT